MLKSIPDKCCLCDKVFDQINFPRMMPSCDHSVCTACLQTTFKNRAQFIQCGFCHNQQEISEADLEYFPKNIAMIKQIKDLKKHPQSMVPLKTASNQQNQQQNMQSQSEKNGKSMNTSDFYLSDDSLLTQKSQPQQNAKKSLCPQHNKQMQIICLTDFTKLCPLCAVFGSHKDHELKTIDETTKILRQTLKQYEQVKVKRKSFQSRIKNPQFKNQLIDKIALKKCNLAKEIKQKFLAVKQAVLTAQKNANEDLSKRFKEMSDTINKVVKSSCQFQQFFNNWTRSIDLQLAETNKINISFEQKVKIYFSGPIKAIKEGQYYLTQLEQFTQQKKMKLQAIPELISLEIGNNLISDIYNYIHPKFDELSFNEQSRRDTNAATLIETKNNYAQDFNSGNSFENYNYNLDCFTQPCQPSVATMNKKPIQVEFSSSKNFLSPNNRDRLQSPKISQNNFQKKLPQSKYPLKPQNPSLKNLGQGASSVQINSERKKQISQNTSSLVESFLADDKLDTLVLCAFDLPDNEIVQLLEYVHQQKKVKCLKLVQNKITNEGFAQILMHLNNTTNINLSSNLLTEEALNILIKNREKVPNLRILNLAHNKVNERKAKMYVDELKKQGIIVTL